jgi:hypothetical protein
MSNPTRPARLSPGTIALSALLLVIPCAALAAVPLYSRETPVLWGFPFFYWYQLLWVFIASGCTYLAYRLVHYARRGGDR